MINRIRANHYNLDESLGRKDYIDSIRCQCGAEKEDVNHVLFICKKYIEEREFMFRKMDKINKTIIRNIEKLIQEKDWERLKIVEQYFKKIGKQI